MCWPIACRSPSTSCRANTTRRSCCAVGLSSTRTRGWGMSLQAYQKAAAQAENPRECEYRLFGQVTRALMAAAQADDLDIRTRIDALDWNRRVWSALAADCSAPS